MTILGFLQLIKCRLCLFFSSLFLGEQALSRALVPMGLIKTVPQVLPYVKMRSANMSKFRWIWIVDEGKILKYFQSLFEAK